MREHTHRQGRRSVSLRRKITRIALVVWATTAAAACAGLAAYEVGSLRSSTYPTNGPVRLHVHATHFVVLLLLVMAASLAAVFLMIPRLHSEISQPVKELLRIALIACQKKDYSVRAAKKSNDEIGRLCDLVNEMLDRTQSAEAALRWAQDESEIRAHEKTLELQKEIAEHKQTERELQDRKRFLDSVIQNVPVAIVAIDAENTVQMCNPAFEKIFGYRQQDIFGRVLADLLTTPELRPEVDANRERLRQNDVTHVVTRRKRSDGTLVDVEAFSVPTKSDGNYTGAVLLYQDITERKRAEKALEERTNLLNSLVENLPVGVVLADSASAAVLMCNPAFEKLFGYRQKDIVGHSIFHLLGSGELRAQMEDAHRQVTEGKVTRLSTHRRRRDGSLVDVEVFGVPVMREGKASDVMVIYYDMTERKLTEQALWRAKEAAESANRAKSEFLANISHEIRTPMNGIIGMTDLVLDTELDSERRDHLNLAKASAESLLSLINDILDYSKIEAGQMDIDSIDFSLGDCIGETMKALSIRAHQKGLELAFEIEPGVPDGVIGDPGRLRQVINNLVGNAIKFTEKGEVILHVKLEAREPQDVCLHFIVADTGIGIAHDKQGAIFEPFKQADGSMTRKYGGTGLGLTISSKLVELMKGRIWVESELSKGSRFHFTVCFRAQSSTARLAALRDPTTLHGMPVLIVDDNATNRQILFKLLSSWGMKPAEAESGTRAMAALIQAKSRGEHFPLILLDAQMPEMDGFALAEYIKRHPDFRAAAVMMLSSSSQRGDSLRCRDLGIAAYLTKPVRHGELLDAILVALGTPAEQETTSVHENTLRKRSCSLRILLAEDNAVNQLLVVRLLEKWGHKVTIASNGRKALEALDKGSYDAILMDVQMPEMNGWEATQAIREKERTTGKHIPIVAMTAHAMKGDDEKCLAAGMDDYLAKPIRTAELTAILDQIGDRKVALQAAERQALEASKSEAVN